MATALQDSIKRALSVMQNRIDGVTPEFVATDEVTFIKGTGNYSRALAFYALQQTVIDPVLMESMR